MDIDAKLLGTDVSISIVAGQLLRLRVAAGGLDLSRACVGPYKRQAAIALLTSALDLGAAIARLNTNDPHHSWVAAHLLHRPQFEHCFRGAFFAGPATDEEARKFVKEDRMPKRTDIKGKASPMTLSQITKSASDHWLGTDWPLKVLEGIKNELHGLVHGGKVIVDVYTHGCGVGADKVTASDVCASMNNSLVVSMAALETLICLSGTSEGACPARRAVDASIELLERMRPISDSVLGPGRNN